MFVPKSGRGLGEGNAAFNPQGRSIFRREGFNPTKGQAAPPLPRKANSHAASLYLPIARSVKVPVSGLVLVA